MNKASTENNSVKRVKISQETRDLYEQRDRSLDNADPDNPVLPPEVWEQYGVIGKYYRPKKTPVTVRMDNDVLAWLKSKGEGHLSRINEILRKQMLEDLKH
ncbi:MAG TPA: BrnA antitoxin family protein [Bryobacteraceae bacterium]|jgi:uncharacterized protein (DUF4415 family)